MILLLMYPCIDKARNPVGWRWVYIGTVHPEEQILSKYQQSTYTGIGRKNETDYQIFRTLIHVI